MKLFLLSLFAITITAKTYSQKFTTKKGGHSYSLDIPDYLIKTYDLNDAATLEYKNTLKEAYVIVIPDSKDELTAVGVSFVNSRDFLSSFIKDYQIQAERRSLTEVVDFKKNKNNHSQVEITFNVGENDLYMMITAVETKTHFYKIMCWTLLKYKDQMRDDYLKISKSLKD